MNDLISTFFKTWKTGAFSQHPDWTQHPLQASGVIASGVETIRPGKPCRIDSNRQTNTPPIKNRLAMPPLCFDGMRPAALKKPPIGVFKYTLLGWGILETPERGPINVPEGSAFLVKVPSEHCYRSAPECPEWTFFWFVFDHPYLIERLFSNPDLRNHVFAFTEKATPVEAAASMIEQLWRGGGNNPHSIETQLLRWMIELEKWMLSQKHPSQARQKLLDQVKNLTLGNISKPLSVEQVAARFGMSRAYFTRHFARTTGLVPAAYMREVRINEAAALLQNTHLSIKEVAARTGFVDTNHLCKCFRSRFHFSPLTYRHLRNAPALLAATAPT
ncbi:AraC family transcriptional regulator [Opitutaceae bacterium TAV4]|nr:AraC family transcriptional regulator [Opitutaceae bacterium TAV4]RRK02639.1 AraC family transcriptional regulator [Opitutaceae bacterium TAV3]